MLDKIELDLVRAKETGNVSYDIKTSLSEEGYAPAIEKILKEIQTPTVIPVEVKESVGAVSARIQKAQQVEEQKISSAKGAMKESEKYMREQKDIQQTKIKELAAKQEELKKLGKEYQARYAEAQKALTTLMGEMEKLPTGGILEQKIQDSIEQNSQTYSKLKEYPYEQEFLKELISLIYTYYFNIYFEQKRSVIQSSEPLQKLFQEIELPLQEISKSTINNKITLFEKFRAETEKLEEELKKQ